MDAGVILLFENASETNTIMVKMSFKGLENLKIRHCQDDETEALVFVKPNSSVAFFLNPINVGEDTTYVNPSWDLELLEESEEANQADPSVKKWVEAVFDDYDTNDDGSFDKTEAWRFCKENLSDMINQANFQTMWLLMDKDNSNDIDKDELACMITKLKNSSL